MTKASATFLSFGSIRVASGHFKIVPELLETSLFFVLGDALQQIRLATTMDVCPSRLCPGPQDTVQLYCSWF